VGWLASPVLVVAAVVAAGYLESRVARLVPRRSAVSGDLVPVVR